MADLPLSDPRAEAAAEDAAAAAALAAHEAATTDTPETPDTPDVGSADPPETPEADATPETPPEPKPRKTIEDKFRDRTAHLTKTISTKDAELTQALAELEAARKLLQAQGVEPPSATTITPVTAAPTPGARTYTAEEFQAEAARVAEAQRFTDAANAAYEAGTKKFPDFEEAVSNLNGLGIMSPTLLDAALATDAAPDVIHHLGTDPDEAARIMSLSPVRMAAEMTKLAAKLTAPKAFSTSNAPAPIRPVDGAVTPTIDIRRISESDDMKAYAAARAKQGSKWAVGMRG